MHMTCWHAGACRHGNFTQQRQQAYVDWRASRVVAPYSSHHFEGEARGGVCVRAVWLEQGCALQPELHPARHQSALACPHAVQVAWPARRRSSRTAACL